MKRLLTIVMGVTAVLAVGVFAFSAVGSNPQNEHTSAPPSKSSRGPTVGLSGYSLSQAPQDAIDFRGNSDIFEATVAGPPQQPRKIEANPETGAPMLVYIPVPLRITAVYKGDLAVGQQVFIRDLGGTAPDGSTLNYEDSFPNSTWKNGAQLFVFSNPPLTLDGDFTAMTPNMLYVETNGAAKSARGKVPEMPIEEMRDKVKARWQ